jgi:hypothetical protein
MRWVVIFVFLFIASAAQSQKFPSELWHEGKIVLESGDTLRGSVKYDLQNDFIQLDANNKLESYTARTVLFFEIFDKLARRYRQFYSLPYTTSGQYKAPVFFELLSEGKMTLLCREAIEYRNFPSSFYNYGSDTRLVLVHKFFLFQDNGTIEEFVGKKNDLIVLMGNKGDPVEKYIKTNKLSVDNKYELAQIVAYYNSLYK